ncbi:hypothetical protein SUGI_0465670 [Cryptomeria japonica]|uniref:uncharacterized protein LOC131031356 n=1 Tax=Cryptomeria japonica TaxID=3369 RepID=UPI002408B7C2|nr:uncharacterized protein LOC131031356 [Cryptomeria japonica]XP_057818435.1 uncharacterized protein LOC131031356 [Cryptomeria japonica]GLJ24383.1 hypothetical protein SUGI_0465670 [Cryptomeria japonica]
MDSEQFKKLQSSGKHERMGSYGEKEIKRKRTDDGEDDEVQQFFALVDRIQAMHRHFRQKQVNPVSAELVSSMEENVGANIIKRESIWKPSFEPEDFSYLYSNVHPSAQSESTSCMNNSATASGASKQLDRGTDKSMPTERFDLNVEPAS